MTTGLSFIWAVSVSVTATLVDSFAQLPYCVGITKVEDKIYFLHQVPNFIKVYEGLNGFRFVTDIGLSRTERVYDIVYSNITKFVYISDPHGNCMWVMTTIGENQLTRCLMNIRETNAFSLSNEGHLLMLKGEPFSQLEIYSLNASLIRTLQLPPEIKNPRHVVQTSTGNFIISHRLNNASSGPFVISKFTPDWKLTHRFIPGTQSTELSDPSHLSLDSENNRLFVADKFNHRVILFYSTALTWRQVILSQEINGLRYPCRLLYDARRKHLFVSQYNYNVNVYELN